MAASEHLSLCDVTATSLRKSFVTPVIRPLLAATDLDRIVVGVSVRSLIKCYETTVTTTTATTAADDSDDYSQTKTTTTTASNTANERSATATAAVDTTAKTGDVSRIAARRIGGRKDSLIGEQKSLDVSEETRSDVPSEFSFDFFRASLDFSSSFCCLSMILSLAFRE